ncbi:CPBP family intramembrane glutamic endopeptidase [uncultured Microbacterium sp.]|uniref:CPBP family intramembrane glutamic endopeptidase n=1 Tax=uncultured Microbacterium sp. TaxID=191216 RepID=UPI00260229B4|nr:CPBP family intramembrane glutamic endopeptidase [uncultured Microbacterium sp.]
MPEPIDNTAPHSSGSAVATADAAAPVQRRSRRTARTDWRLGSRTVQSWREGLLAIALLSLGGGILAGTAALTAGASPLIATLLIWLGMLVPIAVGFARSRPVGLLRFRAIDLLWGFGLGVVLRVVQGWAAGAEGAPVPFPTLVTVDGALADGWWFGDVLAPVVIAPLVETSLFSGVILVALYTVLRRPLGAFTAGLAATLASTSLFVFAHLAVGAGAVADIVAMAALGLVCALLVIFTGRIWGAVLVHAVFNGAGVTLALVGTVFG